LAGIDLKAFARVGAQLRLAEVRSEIAAILKTFPELARATGARQTSSPAGAPKAKKRRRLSAAARKAISDAQKKRWAAQKAKKS
jgi:hypothetical protein